MRRTFVVVTFGLWMFAITISARAGVLVFPTSSYDGHLCSQQEEVANGCAFVPFAGGNFVTGNGATAYEGGDWTGGCRNAAWLFSASAPATKVTVTIMNDYTGPLEDDSRIRLYFQDTGECNCENTGFTFVEYGFPKGGTATLSAAGANIVQAYFDVVGPAGYPVQYTQWAVTSMAVTQPIKPALTLNVQRNADGTFSALVNYTFPGASAPAERTLTLELLPQGEEPAISYPVTLTSNPGTLIVPLGSFDTDRTLRATATACEGTAESEAVIAACASCKGKVGGPVRLFDGVMTYLETDPLPVTIGSEFHREYSSGAAADGRFGKGWSSVFDASALPIDADGGSVAVVKEDRTRAVFRRLTTGVWSQKWPMGAPAGTLMGSEATGYTFQDSGGSIVRTFGTNHRLTRLQDLRSGRAVSITYDGSGFPTSIFDERGNWSCTVTTLNGHITGISVDGRPDLAWTYAYSGSLLTSVTLTGAASAWRTYDYTNNRLSAVHNESGQTIERHDYDAAGRAISSYDASGDITNIQYPASDANGIATTSVTRADNTQATYTQAVTGGQVTTQHVDGGCTSCGTNDETAAYDSNGNLIRQQNGRGHITLSTYDSAYSRRLVATTTAMVPTGCDPETDPAHCRLSSDALAATALTRTAASMDTNYEYADPDWTAKPTRVTRNSVLWAGVIAETFTYDPSTGTALTHTVSGAIDSTGTQEAHTTTTALYNGSEGAAFGPGGAFQTAWLSLPQPAGQTKSVDGPRTDVTDITKYVYYPNDPTVPGAWRGRLAAVSNALGHISRFEDYDAFGHAATQVDPNGTITRLTFDAMGRVLTSTIAGVPGCDTAAEPLCATDLTTTRTYVASMGALASEQQPAGNTTTYAYDTRGRLQSTTRGTASTALERIDYAYDPTTGKKSSEVMSAFENGAWAVKKSETYIYTSDGNLSSVVHADNTSQLFAYLPDGTLKSIQDENHTTPNTTYAYDPANRLSSMTQALTGAPGGQIVTSYGYDVQGNLTSVADPNGNVTTYVYDDFGRMQRQTSPVSGTTTYTYDPTGNVLTTTDANGAVTTRTYDALSRITSSTSTRSGQTDAVTWTYDDPTSANHGLGRLATMTDPSGSTLYQYDRRGLLRTEAKTIGSNSYTTTFAYDANGNRSTMTYPNGTIASYTFDFANRPYALNSGTTSIVSSAAYLPFGPLTSIAFGNGTTRTVQYDARYRTVENKLVGPGGTIADYAYAEDNVGNITQVHDVTDARYNRDFGYDDLNRLITANGGAALWGTGSYSYDKMGNMLTSSLGTWKSTTASLVGTTPKLTSVLENGTARGVTYDAAGNETAVGGSAFTYSPRNALASADTSSYVYDGRAVLTIATISVLSLNVAPSNVTGGGVATGTVTLSAPAVADTTVTLTSSNPSAAGVPPSVVVTAGSTTASFTITTFPVVGTTSVTITSAFNQYSASSTLFVVPPQLSSLAISPSSLVAGNPATGTVTLDGAAAANLAVQLSSNDSAATVPATVTVSAGSTTASFTVTTTPGVANRTATITASLAGVTKTASLTFLDAQLSSLSITPTSIANGGTAIGTVTLNGTAASNIVVTLTPSTPDAYSVGSITIPPGATSGTFTIYSNLQSITPKTVTFTATQGAITRQASITVNPPWLANFTVSPSTLTGGDSSVGTPTLNGPASADGTYSVMFSSTNTALVATPPALNIPAGATTATRRVLTNAVSSSTSVVVTATDPTGISRSQSVTLQPVTITLSTLTLSSSSIVGSNKLTGTVTLTDVAPSPGIDVELKSSNHLVAYPGVLVHVVTGSRTATFTIKTGLVSANTAVTISAIHSATTKTAALTVQVPTAANWVQFVFFDTNQSQKVVTGGASATATVWLGPAATKNTTVTLTSSNTAAASVPTSITVPKGVQTQTFTVTTSTVASAADVTITASAGGTIATASLIVLPSNGVALASISFFQGFVDNGSYWKLDGGTLWEATPVFGFGTVTLTGPAPAGGATVTLSGSRSNIIVVTTGFGTPTTTINVPAGNTSVNFWGQVYGFTGPDRGTTFSFAYGGITRTADVLVTARQQAAAAHHDAVLCASASLAPCLSADAVLRPAPDAVGDSMGYYLYTPELHLLAETEISTAASKAIAYTYLWFGDLPVATFETATNAMLWYATDHLGTPQVMTNAAGSVAWRAEYAPYGTIFTVRTGATVHQPLRFPGQIAQDGSETYYNVFRHYRSSWGRYTQVDPMGQQRGTYMYASADPLGDIDPKGLTPCLMKLTSLLNRPDTALAFVASVLGTCGNGNVKEWFNEALTPTYVDYRPTTYYKNVKVSEGLGSTDSNSLASYVYASAFDRGAEQVVQTSGHEVYHQIKLRRHDPSARDEFAADLFGWMAEGQFKKLSDCECDLCR